MKMVCLHVVRQIFFFQFLGSEKNLQINSTEFSWVSFLKLLTGSHELFVSSYWNWIEKRIREPHHLEIYLDLTPNLASFQKQFFEKQYVFLHVLLKTRLFSLKKVVFDVLFITQISCRTFHVYITCLCKMESCLALPIIM